MILWQLSVDILIIYISCGKYESNVFLQINMAAMLQSQYLEWAPNWCMLQFFSHEYFNDFYVPSLIHDIWFIPCIPAERFEC